jgi:transposase-like protein
MEQLIPISIAILFIVFYSCTDIILVTIFKTSRNCPDCGKKFPRFRIPVNFRQAFLGGWTCTKCGCQVNSFGRKINTLWRK